jgi:hypothetical protein
MLPTGHLDSWGLTGLTPRLHGNAGSFVGGGWKTCWHTTEGGSMESVVRTLVEKGAEVHIVFDPKNGRFTQMIPFNRAGRGLRHPSGPETNRANVIQVEVIGFATVAQAIKSLASPRRAVPLFGADEYRRLAALALLIEHRRPVPRHARAFMRPVRMGGQAFYDFAGHVGHCHVPGNDHGDPGRLDWPRMLAGMNRMDH